MTIGLIIYWLRQSSLVAGFGLVVLGIAAFDWRWAVIAAGLTIGVGAAWGFIAEKSKE